MQLYLIQFPQILESDSHSLALSLILFHVAENCRGSGLQMYCFGLAQHSESDSRWIGPRDNKNSGVESHNFPPILDDGL